MAHPATLKKREHQPWPQQETRCGQQDTSVSEPHGELEYDKTQVPAIGDIDTKGNPGANLEATHESDNGTVDASDYPTEVHSAIVEYLKQILSDTNFPDDAPGLDLQNSDRLLLLNRIEQAFHKSRDWRSAWGIAKDTGLTQDMVQRFMKSHSDLFEVSPITPCGIPLYRLKSK